MTATEGDGDSDYEHWTDDDHFLSTPPVAAGGYDSHNGLRSHTYQPAETEMKEKKAAPTPASPKVASPSPHIFYTYPPQQPQMMAYPPMQFSYPMPGYPLSGYPMPGYGMPMPGCYAYAPPAAQPVNYQYAAPKPSKWQGRSKKEVDEDNMKIAAKEGAYDKRKVEPVGVKDDQMMWCVETDGSHTLRCAPILSPKIV